ncbi:exonuclease domain-containing protein [Halomonas sp. Bachu 37]|uniref:3'-5' exonuclease family protein n=1 Tax=Halomonas kashgarensis TaxID=3084920 RepID=UPI003216464E
MTDRPLIFIDLETTGTRTTRDRIIEIAAYKTMNGETVSRWVSLVNPQNAVPAPITRLTGLDEGILETAPSFAELARDFMEWLGDGILVAHNARFDYGFLRNEFKRAGLAYRARILCTLRLSRRLDPSAREHGLTALLERNGISPASHHRADDDVSALMTLWRKWQEGMSATVFIRMLELERRHASLPAHLDASILEQIPSTPGVYLFYGHNRVPLYIGKSINLRSRVLGHFQRDYQEEREMRLAQQVQHIEWHETSGDLGAQLLESRLIKQLSPVMNRKLRRQSNLSTWQWKEEMNAPRLLSGNQVDMQVEASLFGLFRSARDAQNALRQIADEAQLCPRLLGLEKGKGRCFSSQLGKCRGACHGSESITEHSRRARQALSHLKLRAWPWQGRIAIGEAPTPASSRTWHIVNNWCYLGAVDHLQDAAKLGRDTVQFDGDSYRILNRFLRDRESQELEVVNLEH